MRGIVVEETSAGEKLKTTEGSRKQWETDQDKITHHAELKRLRVMSVAETIVEKSYKGKKGGKSATKVTGNERCRTCKKWVDCTRMVLSCKRMMRFGPSRGAVVS